MPLFDDLLGHDESLFTTPEALDFDYLPRLLKYRENQHQEIAQVIKPLFQKRNASHLLIAGKPGIGKTAACKFILREMEQATSDIFPIYVNCWKKDTTHKILLDICEQIGYKWVYNKSTDELWKNVLEILNKKSAVIVFDEVDKLESEQILYGVLEDVYRKCVILITNDMEWLAHLDQRVRSRLLPQVNEFQPYTASETEGILKERVDLAFVKKVWQDDAFELIADRAVELRDIRTGIFLLKEAGNIAEQKSSRKILKEHASLALEKLNHLKIRKSTDLTDEDKEILNLVKKEEGKTTKEIYDFYSRQFDKSYRTFQRRIKELEEAGLISFSEEISAQGGKAVRVYLVKNH